MQQKATPTKRCAILIGNDRWGGISLPGVSKDIKALKQFLLSPYGGSWHPSEILEIYSPNSRQYFIKLLKGISEVYDYIFIYFAGHGQLSTYLDPIFIFPGKTEIALADIKSAFENKPVLMISDSCQGLPEYRQGGILKEELEFISPIDPVKEFKARRRFDKALVSLSPMFVYASAVSPGQSAKEGAIGGCYTQHLIDACQFIIDDTSKQPGVYDISYPHSIASLAVETITSREQRPSISGIHNSLQPPFLIKL